MKELLNKILDYLYLLAGTCFLSFNFILSLKKPLWLDEVETLIIINANGIWDLILNIYEGVDHNAPLYFIIMYFVNIIVGEQIIILKIISFTFILMSITLSLYMLRSKINLSTYLFLFLFLSINSFFSKFLITEIRMYGLFFGLTIVWILYLYINSDRSKLCVKGLIIYTLLLTALLYVHYYSFFYIFIVLTIEIFFSLRNKCIKNIIPYLVSFFLFSPWLLAIKNQVESIQGYFWQQVPDLYNLSELYLSFVGKIGILLFLLFSLILIFYLTKNKDLGNIEYFLKSKQLLFVTLLSFIIVPIFIFITSLFEITVFVKRYFIPTYIILIVILGVLYQESKIYNYFYLKLLILIVLIIIGCNRVNNYNQFVINEEENLTEKLDLNNMQIPIICESPHSYYPLEFYSQEIGNSNFYFILDYESAIKKGNVKNAPLDYYWNSSLKKCYDLPRIIEWDDFKSKHKNFLLINEKDRMLFENRLEKNPDYSWRVFQDNIYIIESIK